MTTLSFSDRLAAKIQECGSPLMVGLDPRWDRLPNALKQGDPNDLHVRALAYRKFCQEVIDAVQGLTAVVKPQAAFFEQAGPQGMQALWDVIQYARQAGLLVVLDGKRNDIGSTAQAYAEGYLGEQSAWKADALTVSPYLGEEGLRPFMDCAAQRNAGVFVLVKTSNLGGGYLQDVSADGKTIYRRVAHLVESASSKNTGASGYGPVGAVVGATYPAQLAELRAAMPHAWLLVPGFGARRQRGRCRRRLRQERPRRHRQQLARHHLRLPTSGVSKASPSQLARRGASRRARSGVGSGS